MAFVGTGVDAGHVQCGRELQDRGRRGPAVLRCDVISVLRPGLLRQDGVCLARVHDLHRTTVHSEGDRECRGLSRFALQLSLFEAAAAPPARESATPACTVTVLLLGIQPWTTSPLCSALLTLRNV